MTPSRATIRTAARLLDLEDFAVWTQKHIRSLGRRAGAKELGISEEAWRWRLNRAERIIREAQQRETAA